MSAHVTRKKKAMNRCLVCDEESVVEILDIGMQPMSNRYVTELTDKEYTHQIMIGQCNVCGLVQLIDPVSSLELVPPFEWIKFNEPEEHLNHMVDIISKLPNITKDSKICGISYKEDSTLKRFRKRGFGNTWSIDLVNDWGIQEPGAGIETIQDHVRLEHTKMLSQRHGVSDVVIARHILEHAHNTRSFMDALKGLVKPEGYIVFEIPDSTKAFENSDYSIIWEEHVIYFIPRTFRHTLETGGFSIFHFETYFYPYENSLVAIVQMHDINDMLLPSDSVLESERKMLQSFAQNLTQRRDEIKHFLSAFRQDGGKIAMFGAGHLACMFINLMDLKDTIKFVVDDNPNKRGLFMPGSKLPIVDSATLVEEDINLCLMSVRPEVEEKVIRKNHQFIVRGGEFASILSLSQYSLWKTFGEKNGI